jgi:hypothetical protein
MSDDDDFSLKNALGCLTWIIVIAVAYTLYETLPAIIDAINRGLGQ